jgi:hypothetical protein
MRQSRCSVVEQETSKLTAMKTRYLLTTSVAILASGLFTAATLAGPGPQYWNMMEKIRAENAAKARTPVTMESHPSGTCDGCKTSPIVVTSDRGPAGKGIYNSKIVGQRHTCTGCAGTITTEKGNPKTSMIYATGCATLACCK